MTRRVLALMGILGIALLLAFPLRDAVYQAVIVPAAYVLWVLGLIYHSVHQSVWWIVVLLVVLVILSRSLLPGYKPAAKELVKMRPVAGQVEGFAGWMKRSQRGTYFKWLVANRLGKIAYQILVQRESGKQRSVFEPLTGTDWDPGDGLRSYLESGLHDSFADFSNPHKLFSRPVPTSLDHDVTKVVDFLESQVRD
jgi:hypothetical protein